MTVRYTDKAARDLESLPRKDQQRILDALDRFAVSGVGDVRALGGRWRGSSDCELGTGGQSSAWKMKSLSFASRLGGRYIGKRQSGGSNLNAVYDRRSKAMTFARSEIMIDFGA